MISKPRPRSFLGCHSPPRPCTAPRKEGPAAIADAFDLANTKLGDSEWAIGSYSIADIHVFRIYWRFLTQIDAAPGTYPALESHHDRMLARPAVQKAMEFEKAYG